MSSTTFTTGLHHLTGRPAFDYRLLRNQARFRPHYIGFAAFTPAGAGDTKSAGLRRSSDGNISLRLLEMCVCDRNSLPQCIDRQIVALTNPGSRGVSDERVSI